MLASSPTMHEPSIPMLHSHKAKVEVGARHNRSLSPVLLSPCPACRKDKPADCFSWRHRIEQTLTASKKSDMVIDHDVFPWFALEGSRKEVWRTMPVNTCRRRR